MMAATLAEILAVLPWPVREVVVVPENAAVAAPRLRDKIPDVDARFVRMTPKELFRWALNAPLEDKPWRVVYAIEMWQKDPVAWGWQVNPEFEDAIIEKYPDEQPITVWAGWRLLNGKTFNVPQASMVAGTVFHLRVTDGVWGRRPKRDEW